MKSVRTLLIVLAGIAMTGCSTLMSIGNNLNMYSVEDDKALGRQTYLQIKADTDHEYPLLDTVKYAAAYTQIRGIFNALINVGLTYRDVFDWKLYIIDRDDVLNAFAIPGGTVFIYTGLINYLDNESQLAGVLAHEISHIDLRHSTKQLTKAYSTEFLTSLIAASTQSTLLQTAAGLTNTLVSLAFSRNDEYEADALATLILAATGVYDPFETAGFFQKMMDDQSSGATIEMLSTHPSDAHRIAAIQKRCESMEREPFTSAQLAPQVASLNTLKQKIK